MKTKTLPGMTLIELLIVISILGILSMISYKAFKGQQQAIHRSDAHTSLLAIQNSIENLLLVGNKSLSDALTSYQNTYPSPKGYYKITVTPTPNASNIRGYKITASACQDTANPCKSDGQKNDSSCLSISLSSDGTKDPTSCW